jgi:hypothetical protein
MNAMLGQFSRETGALSDVKSKIASWFLPTVLPVMGLPIVPDGSVAGRPYIPPNTTADIVGNAQTLQTSAVRVIGATAAVGLIIGAIGGYIAGRGRRRG